MCFFSLKTFRKCRYKPQNSPSTWIPPSKFFKMLLNRYLSIKLDIDSETFLDSSIALSVCMVHSVVNNSRLNYVELNFFSEEVQYRHFTLKLLTYFSRAQIFGKFIGVWGSLDQCGMMGAPRTGTFFENLGLRKMCSKLLTLFFCAHADSFGNGLSIIRL